MADRIVGLEVLPAGGAGLQVKYHDNGDSTFSPQVFTGPATSNASSTAVEASHVVKATPGTLMAMTICNTGAVAQFYQLHDAAALPANAAVPVLVIYLAAKANQQLNFGPAGRAFANGIVVCNSSTAGTKTIGAADSFFDAQFV